MQVILTFSENKSVYAQSWSIPNITDAAESLIGLLRGMIRNCFSVNNNEARWYGEIMILTEKSHHNSNILK